MLLPHLLCASLLAATAVNHGTVGEVYLDGRDAWTLQPQKLINRELFEQLHAPGQDFRLGRNYGSFAAAADSRVGAQVAPPGSELARFHGAYSVDTFWALRLFEGVDVNLNLSLLNPSASDGYRFSSQIHSGAALHLHKVLGFFHSEAVKLDFVGVDLDLVTLGAGLFIEQVPLEGHMASLRWNGFELQEVFGGRVFWADDDFISVALGAADGALQLRYINWLADDIAPGEFVWTAAQNGGGGDTPRTSAQYMALSSRWQHGDRWRLAGEVGVRARGMAARTALLARADFMEKGVALFGNRLTLHVGYQFRYYERGFGPRDTLVTSTAAPNVPSRENAYVTNSFEYFSASKFYDQWSHTVMSEGRLAVSERVTLAADVEYWGRTMRDPRHGGKRVSYVHRFGRAPGTNHRVFYRGGIHLQPWHGHNHQARLFVTNKLVASRLFAVDPDARRFVHDPLFVFEVEVFL